MLYTNLILCMSIGKYEWTGFVDHENLLYTISAIDFKIFFFLCLYGMCVCMSGCYVLSTTIYDEHECLFENEFPLWKLSINIFVSL